MMRFEQPIPDDPANQWRYQLDQFVQENQQELAGLMWGLLSEWGEDAQETLGIDLNLSPILSVVLGVPREIKSQG